MTEERFGKVLSELRQSKNVTIEKLAEMVTMPMPVLANIENGNSWPCSDILGEIEHALNLNDHECSELEHSLYNDKADKCMNIVSKNDLQKATDSDQKEHVNHPDHYHPGQYEVIKVMAEYYGREAVTDFCLLNAFKYVSRAKQKNGLEDIKKAAWYLNYIIETEDQP